MLRYSPEYDDIFFEVNTPEKIFIALRYIYPAYYGLMNTENGKNIMRHLEQASN